MDAIQTIDLIDGFGGEPPCFGVGGYMNNNAIKRKVRIVIIITIDCGIEIIKIISTSYEVSYFIFWLYAFFHAIISTEP